MIIIIIEFVNKLIITTTPPSKKILCNNREQIEVKLDTCVGAPIYYHWHTYMFIHLLELQLLLIFSCFSFP